MKSKCAVHMKWRTTLTSLNRLAFPAPSHDSVMTHTHTHAHNHAHTHAPHKHIYKHTCTHTHAHTHTHTNMHTHIHTLTRARTHIHTHTWPPRVQPCLIPPPRRIRRKNSKKVHVSTRVTVQRPRWLGLAYLARSRSTAHRGAVAHRQGDPKHTTDSPSFHTSPRQFCVTFNPFPQ